MSAKATAKASSAATVTLKHLASKLAEDHGVAKKQTEALLGDLVGQVFVMFTLTVAAAEAAIGLAIVVIYFRNRGSIQVEDVNMMKG